MERLDEVEEELTGKSKLVFEACSKITQGRQLLKDGKFELANLLGEHSKTKMSRLTAGQKSAITKKKKLIAHRESGFRKDVRPDQDIKDAMVRLVRLNRQASSTLLQKKLRLSDRRLNRLLGQLVGDNKLRDEGSGKENSPHKWVIPKSPKTKKINGHKLAKTSGGGKQRGTFIDVTNPEIVNKALSLLNTDDWVTKGKLINVIDMSAGVANRLLDHMKKQKLVKEVVKKHNPAHKSSPKNFERLGTYFEAVAS